MRLDLKLLLLLFLSVLLFQEVGYSQPASIINQDTINNYPAINENLFLHTKWKYTFATHAESNMVIHKAQEGYEHFLFFKWDNTLQIFLNGEFSYSKWKITSANNAVYCPFRRIDWWAIVSFTDEELILEYDMNNSKFRYHFIRVTDSEAPFLKDLNELPDVLVQYGDGEVKSSKFRFLKNEKGKRQRYSKWRQRRRKRIAERRARKNENNEPPKEFLQVELVGGGYFGGIERVYKNILTIKSDGSVLHEYQTEEKGLVVTKHKITREDLEALVAFIEEKNFFSFEKVYACSDFECAKRLKAKPRPIALRIAVSKGFIRKVITISIWDGKNKSIDYPTEIDLIVKAIKDIAFQ